MAIEEKRIGIRVKNDRERLALLGYLINSGRRWHCDCDDNGLAPKQIIENYTFQSYPIVILKGEKDIMGGGLNVNAKFEYYYDNVDDFYQKELNNCVIDLNTQYQAKLNFDKRTVTVGCQEFSFAKVKELYEATKQ